MRDAKRTENGKHCLHGLTDASQGQAKELPRWPRAAWAPAFGLAAQIEGRTTVPPAKKICGPRARVSSTERARVVS
jgi:hypothetical protein